MKSVMKLLGVTRFQLRYAMIQNVLHGIRTPASTKYGRFIYFETKDVERYQAELAEFNKKYMTRDSFAQSLSINTRQIQHWRVTGSLFGIAYPEQHRFQGCLNTYIKTSDAQEVDDKLRNTTTPGDDDETYLGYGLN